jgi:hypothetical protein
MFLKVVNRIPFQSTVTSVVVAAAIIAAALEQFEQFYLT